MPERLTDWQAYGIALLHQELPEAPGPIRRFVDTGEIGGSPPLARRARLFVTGSFGPTPTLKLAPLGVETGAGEGRQPRSDKLFWPHPERVGSLSGGGG